MPSISFIEIYNDEKEKYCFFTFDLEASTLPQDHQGRQGKSYCEYGSGVLTEPFCEDPDVKHLF